MSNDDAANICGIFFEQNLEELKEQLVRKLRFKERGWDKTYLARHPGQAASFVRHLDASDWQLLSGLPELRDVRPNPHKELHLVLYGSGIGEFKAAVHCEPDDQRDVVGHIYMFTTGLSRGYVDSALPNKILGKKEAVNNGWYADYRVGTILFFKLVSGSGLNFKRWPAAVAAGL